MTTDAPAATIDPLGPWHPGIESTLPAAFLPLSTMHRPENVATTLTDARHLRELSGLPLHQLTALRPERLVIHELLIRVMANLHVPDGDRYTDLGENSRHMTQMLLTHYVEPLLPACSEAHARLCADARVFIDGAVAEVFAPPARSPEPEHKRSLWQRLTGARPEPAPAPKRQHDITLRGEDAIAATERWRRAAANASDPFEAACYRALDRAGTAILNRTGCLGPERAPLVALATQFVGNTLGSDRIGDIIDPAFRSGAERLGYRFVPVQAAPIVMNVKGASAAGKSTLRPRQRMLAENLGVNWEDFALISPDIWRKYLLDYASLGEARRYAGTLTGHEIEVIDRKLDAYMAKKAEAGRMTHLLIDRFRFDSFSSGEDGEAGRRLLTRFGSSVYMFFMITPPAATVERAWARGEKVGRYKAVDDLLAHNVEAYTGIPNLFFTWVLRKDKHVHFEFLDNSVPQGTNPRTVAFGITDHMIVLDVAHMLDIDRFRALNVNARHPGEIFVNPTGKPIEYSAEFLRACVRRLPVVEFAGHATGDVYLRIEGGRCVYWDAAGAAAANPDPTARAAVTAIVTAATVSHKPPDRAPRPRALSPTDADTLGSWGEAYKF